MMRVASKRKFPFARVQGRGVNHNIYSQSSWTSGAPNVGTNYVAASTKMFDYYATKGVTFVRLMFTWEWLQPTLGATIPGSGAYLTYWNNFVSSVNYITNTLGMECLIEHFGSCDDYWGVGSPNTVPAWKGVGSANGSSYTNQVGGGSVTNANFADLWTKLATYFKDNPRVVFGMLNEPHDMSTMQWFGTAQAVITAIRATGATQKIFVPGNGYATYDWASSSVDNAGTPRSNTYGWDNANGVGSPLYDPLGKIYPSVHIYVDDAGGSTSDVSTAIKPLGAGTAANAAVDRLKVAVAFARPRGLRVHVSEIGFSNTYTNASSCWANFIAYCNENRDVVEGYSWWGSSDAGWWGIDETHFGVYATSTGGATFSGDTAIMTMIKNDFVSPV